MAEFDEILDIEQLIDKVHQGFVVLYTALMTLEVNGVLNDSNSLVTMINCRTIDGVDTWDEVWSLCGENDGVELLYQANFQRGTMEWGGAAQRPYWVDHPRAPWHYPGVGR